MCPAIVSGIVTWDAPSAIGQLFSLYLVTVPEVFAKVNSAQFPSQFQSGEFILQIRILAYSICLISICSSSSKQTIKIPTRALIPHRTASCF